MRHVVGAILAGGLMYATGLTLFRRHAQGALTLALFVLTPLFVNHVSAGAGELPFAVAWLLCALRYDETKRTGWLATAGGVLGLGLYRSDAALVMMPAFAAVTMLWLATRDAPRGRPLSVFAGALALAAAPLAVMAAHDPDVVAGAIVRLGIYDARTYGVVHGVRELLNWNSATERSGVYYDYFSPVFLLLQGESLVDALRYPRMFLLPYALLLPAGAHGLLTREPTSRRWLILGGLLSAPLVPALRALPDRPDAVVAMLPFASLIAAHGAIGLLSSKAAAGRLLGVTALAAVAACFAIFVASLP